MFRFRGRGYLIPSRQPQRHRRLSVIRGPVCFIAYLLSPVRVWGFFLC